MKLAAKEAAPRAYHGKADRYGESRLEFGLLALLHGVRL
jgi:hypothetical protein